MEELDLAKLPGFLSDEAEAWTLLERMRWSDGAPVCPHCGTVDAKHYFLTAQSGPRRTRTGNISYRRLWKCRERSCRKQFSVLMGTIFESSKVSVSKWLLALWWMSTGTKAVSGSELHRQLGVAQQTAWFMSHRMKEAMRREPLAGLATPRFEEMLSALLQVDPTGIIGQPRKASRNSPASGMVSPAAPT
jgi:transposase-like protein